MPARFRQLQGSEKKREVQLGIDPMEITYVENPWSGGGNAGPAVEVIVGGLELATRHANGWLACRLTTFQRDPETRESQIRVCRL